MIIIPYPRTYHMEGSVAGAGTQEKNRMPFSVLKGKHAVVEEKVDGSMVGISFDDRGKLILQNRGNPVAGGSDSPFSILKTWINIHHGWFKDVLGKRYVVFGEWLFAKHTVFYDKLPHYFLEFDVFDKEQGVFLSTYLRQVLFDGSPVLSVKVLDQGVFEEKEKIYSLIGRCSFKTPEWKENLEASAILHGVPREIVWKQTDASGNMEGLYIKTEEGDRVTGRYKFIRTGFLGAIRNSGSHWKDRIIIPNQLDARLTIEDLLG